MRNLINAAYKSYDRLSRYSNFPYYYNRKDNKYIYGTQRHLKNTTAYTGYVVRVNDTWDSISLNFYNNPTYFWIICDYNRIRDPYSLPEVGETVRVPILSGIEFED